tara:strand:- start:26676 stop:27359 length:684 start_codon:yes stop_codon:yes gene_type:complete
MRPPKTKKAHKKKPRKKLIQKDEVVERIIYIWFWLDIAIYVGQSYLTGVQRACNHRMTYKQWLRGTNTHKLAYYDYLKEKTDGILWTKPRGGKKPTTIPEFEMRVVVTRIMDGFEADRLEDLYMYKHRATVLNKKTNANAPRSVHNPWFGGICFKTKCTNHPWEARHSRYDGTRYASGKRKKQYKSFATLREAYDHLVAKYEEVKNLEELEGVTVRPFTFYEERFGD